MPEKEMRVPVTRERAIEAAVALADAGGLDSLSMRKLATQLGIEAMSLYFHVKSKDDLLDGMLDVVYSEIPNPVPEDEWRHAMRLRSLATRETLACHRWAIDVKARRSPGPATLAHVDAAVGCLLTAGFSMPMAGHALSVIDSYVLGFVHQELSLPLDADGDIAEVAEDIVAQQQAMAQEFPHLARMAAELILQPGYSYGQEFEFGLDLVLDGLARVLESP